ncbi:hypothetical protein [Pseudoxanthomonas sp. LjRoot143]|uniref:hypothetical protein n=1 Tax=Pseudoxanthomonas sp. LjRoot143 TaxID=3342266 RepID=UPI003F507B26
MSRLPTPARRYGRETAMPSMFAQSFPSNGGEQIARKLAAIIRREQQSSRSRIGLLQRFVEAVSPCAPIYGHSGPVKRRDGLVFCLKGEIRLREDLRRDSLNVFDFH